MCISWSTNAQCPLIIKTIEPTYAIDGSVFLNGAGLKETTPIKVLVQYEHSGVRTLSAPKSIADTCREWSVSYRLKGLSPGEIVTYRYVLIYGTNEYAVGGDMCVQVPQQLFDTSRNEINLTYFFHPSGEELPIDWDAELENFLTQNDGHLPFNHRVFPNPIDSGDWLTLSVAQPVLEVYLFDMYGRGLLAGKGTLTQIFIDINPGIYILVQGMQDGSYCIDKLIVQ
jgi:hypothetical protein